MNHFPHAFHRGSPRSKRHSSTNIEKYSQLIFRSRFPFKRKYSSSRLPGISSQEKRDTLVSVLKRYPPSKTRPCPSQTIFVFLLSQFSPLLPFSAYHHTALPSTHHPAAIEKTSLPLHLFRFRFLFFGIPLSLSLSLPCPFHYPFQFSICTL